MEHVFSHLKDFGPWAATVALGVLAKVVHSGNQTMRSLGETKFKADEAHEEVSERVPEYARRYKTWLAHRKTF